MGQMFALCIVKYPDLCTTPAGRAAKKPRFAQPHQYLGGQPSGPLSDYIPLTCQLPARLQMEPLWKSGFRSYEPSLGLESASSLKVNRTSTNRPFPDLIAGSRILSR